MIQQNVSGCEISRASDVGSSFHPRMTIPLVTFTASSVGNLIAIFVIRRNQSRSDKKSVFYTLVMTLALLDLISTWATSPVTFVSYSTRTSVCQLGGPVLCHYSGITMIFFGFSTMAIVFTMSVERLMAIRFAFFYHTKVNVHKTKIAIAVVIFIFLLISCFPLVGFGEITQQLPGTWCFLNWRATLNQHQGFNFLVVTMGTAMLGGTIFCNIYVIFRVIRKRRKMKICNSTLQVMSKRRLRKMAVDELQMMILLGVMTCVFTLCYLPLLIRIFVSQLTAIYSVRDETSSWNLFAVRMASINPILDPWVYILCRRSTMVGFFRIMKMTFLCKCSKDELAIIFASGREYKRRKSSANLQLDSNNTANHNKFSRKVADDVGDDELALKFGKIWKDRALRGKKVVDEDQKANRKPLLEN